jgi:prevent-host-death family protein
MPKLPRIVPITDLRQDAAAVLERVKDSAEPIVITQRGRAAAVLLSPEVFERSEQERQMLRALARGERDIRKNRGVDLDRVLAEADDILEAES